MRLPLPLCLAVAGVMSLACGADHEPDLVPSGGHLPPADVGVAPYAGRWPAVIGGEGEGGGGWGLAAACGDPRFVQVRSDGVGGWELLTGEADELRILPVRSAATTAEGARFDVAPEPEVTLTWVEPERIARFSLVPDATFAAPEVARSLADARCPGP